MSSNLSQPPKSSRGLRTHLPESSLPLHPDGYLPVVFVICTSHCIILLLKLFSTSHYSQEKVNQSSCTHWTKSPPLYPASSGATFVPPHSAVAEQPLSSTQDQSHRPENFHRHKLRCYWHLAGIIQGCCYILQCTGQSPTHIPTQRIIQSKT